VLELLLVALSFSSMKNLDRSRQTQKGLDDPLQRPPSELLLDMHGGVHDFEALAKGRRVSIHASDSGCESRFERHPASEEIDSSD